ncbi:MAG: hypothetical protein RJA58_1571 [Pseudomonadota bacterium]
MTSADVFRLVLLSAIWGGSFMLMRIASPVFGPAIVAEGRLVSAAIFLFVLAKLLKRSDQLLSRWRYLLTMGFFGSALPFILIGTAALSLSTAQLSVLNATASIWAYLIGLMLRDETFSLRRLVGFALGISGVAVMFGDALFSQTEVIAIPLLCALGGAFSYGIATNYTRRAERVEPFVNAHGSMWAASLLVIPSLWFIPAKAPATVEAVSAVILLGIICSGVAYLLYFRLLRDIGAPSTLTVTFLIPLFGTLWGALFLGEAIGLQTVLGMSVILLGTGLSTGFGRSWLARFRRRTG